MTELSKKSRLSRTRRLILLAGGAVVLALVVLTLAPVTPRPVDLDVVLQPGARTPLRLRTVVRAGDEVVLEDERTARGGGGVVLRDRYWLRPEQHRVEVTAPGCPRVERRFTPGEVDRVVVSFGCGSPPASEASGR